MAHGYLRKARSNHDACQTWITRKAPNVVLTRHVRRPMSQAILKRIHDGRLPMHFFDPCDLPYIGVRDV
jgi:hypothetical protein